MRNTIVGLSEWQSLAMMVNSSGKSGIRPF
jgi:hypothetical protein